MKIKARSLRVFLLAVFATLCCAVGIAVNEPKISAQAAAGQTFSITKNNLTIKNPNDARAIQVGNNSYAEFDITLPEDAVIDWDTRATYATATGDGSLLNGEPITLTIKNPGKYLYVELPGSVTLAKNDVLTIDGEFVNNQSTNYTFDFDRCAFQWDGSKWSKWSGTYVTINSISGTTNTQINLTAGNTFGSRSGNFTGEAKLNGENVTLGTTTDSYKLSSSRNSSNLTFTFPAVEKGDVVSLAGLYKVNNTNYYIADNFYWDGSAWTMVDGYVVKSWDKSIHDYSDPNRNGFFLSFANNFAIADWSTALTTNNGKVTINNQEVRANIKLVNQDLYVELISNIPKEGDIMTVEGLYSYKNLVSIAFNPTTMLFTNGAWMNVELYDLGELSVASRSSTAGQYATASQLYLQSAKVSTLPIQNENDLFVNVKGLSFMVNGTQVPFSAMKSTSNGVYFAFDAVKTDDIVAVGGLYRSGTTVYSVETSYFIWNGSNWAVGDPRYTVIENDATIGNAYAEGNDKVPLKSGFYFENLPGTLGVSTWDYALSLQSGEGAMLNGEPIDIAIKPFAKRAYIDIKREANAGDMVSISGTYYAVISGITVELIIEETQYARFDGENWGIPTQAVYEVGELVVATASSEGGVFAGSKTQLLLAQANGKAFSAISWDIAYTLEGGAGLKVNGESVALSAVKFTGEGLYLEFPEMKAGAVYTISGTFVSEQTIYIIEENDAVRFFWNGKFWERSVDNTYNAGMLKATSDSNASQIYLKKEDGNAFEMPGSWDNAHKFTFHPNSGVGFTLNGVQLSMDDIKIPGEIYAGLGVTAKAGDVLVVEGTFYNKPLNVAYVVEKSTFEWNGSAWITKYEDGMLADYDTITILDLGWDVKEVATGILDGSGLSYTPSAQNDTGSVVFRFGYNSVDANVSEVSVRLRGGAWSGFYFCIQGSKIMYVQPENDKNIYNTWVSNLANNTDYVIEIGAIDMVGDKVWLYVRVDGILMAEKVVEIDDNNRGFDTNRVSVYICNTAGTTISDPDNVSVSYVGGDKIYLAKGSEVVLENVTNPNFIAWAVNGNCYKAGETIVANDNLVVEKIAVDLKLQDGASIRVAADADGSGIRFTGKFNLADLENLAQYNVELKEFGILIMPNAYLAEGQAPNLTDFSEANNKILKIENTGREKNDQFGGYEYYYGAMIKIREKNYAREFAGRAYMIVVVDGVEVTIYSEFTSENVRSIRGVATAFKADKTPSTDGSLRYDDLSDARKAIVEAYLGNVVVPEVDAETMAENYAAAYVVGSKENYIRSNNGYSVAGL